MQHQPQGQHGNSPEKTVTIIREGSEMAKIIGIVGSPRRGGNTELLTKEVLQAAAAEGVETELILLAGKDIKPCDGCRQCREKNIDCHLKDDLPPIFHKIMAAEGLILATPVYIGSATAQIKALIDRVYFWSGAYGRPLENKVGAPLVVARRAGQNFTFAQLIFFFFLAGMIIPGPTYWTIAFGKEKGEVAQDEEGIKTARNLGKKIAWLTKKLH
jgi:multimeric flavodoxin WrbA